MSATNGPGSARRHRRHGIGSPSIARASIPPTICPATRAGCTPTAIPASTSSIAPAASPRWRAWRISGASSRCVPVRGLGHRRGGDQAHRRALRRGEGGPRPAARCSGCGSGRRRPSRSSTIWKPGCSAQLPKISGKSELAKAIRYALTRMKKLRPYLDHGFLEADNNSAERSMKPIALGRKNYPLRRLRGRRQIGRHRLHPDRDRQAQRRRSAGLAHRCPRSHRRPQDHPYRRTAPLALRCSPQRNREPPRRRQSAFTGRSPST